MSNLFYCLDKQWFTPPIDRAGVDGIQRQLILQFTQDSQQAITERALHISEIGQVSAAFMTNRLIEMVPISQLCERNLQTCNDFIAQIHHLMVKNNDS